MAVGDDPPAESNTTEESCSVVVVDPPPPYPSRERRRSRASRHSQRTQTLPHPQFSSLDSHSDQDVRMSSQVPATSHPFPDEHEEGDEREAAEQAGPVTPTHTRRYMGRPRSFSHGSATSVAPSLAQTMISMFRTEDHEDDMVCGVGAVYLPLSGEDEQDQQSRTQMGAWRRYFRPLTSKAYYSSLFHLVAINFPYALAAWIYLFVFTVAGTTLLMALPLGAILCFFNLIGARAFAKGELYLQSRFHYPLSYPAPYPPRPIFTRRREATSAEVEMGVAAAGDLVSERSFYKNSYAMFTDPTSYQALFYFLVIKPSITIVFSLVILVFVLPALILVLPAPAALRAVRRLGIWQANVAIEGLYLAVR
ncbi:hypothetical protein C0995_005186 [Termitomyces sp. Mi166|nr:hypothetical protein C0995_005186 [Termitomyces sp. Mi166\